MPFDDLMTDIVSVYDEEGNLVKEKIKASVQGGKAVHTLNADFKVDIGYFVERKLPSGIIEKFKVLEPNYCGNFHGIPAHYQMTVVNVKAIPDPSKSSTINTIHASGNARVYQHSTDNSTNSYSSYEYKEAIGKIKSDILDLDLDPVDQALTTKAVSKLAEEVESGTPNKDKISAYISLLPAAVSGLESVVKLATMVGLN